MNSVSEFYGWEAVLVIVDVQDALVKQMDLMQKGYGVYAVTDAICSRGELDW